MFDFDFVKDELIRSTFIQSVFIIIYRLFKIVYYVTKERTMFLELICKDMFNND